MYLRTAVNSQSLSTRSLLMRAWTPVHPDARAAGRPRTQDAGGSIILHIAMLDLYQPALRWQRAPGAPSLRVLRVSA
jgi:hypothetical protein